TAPAFLQHQRALARPGMDDVRLKGVLAKQMPDAQKRIRADAVIQSGLGKAHTLRSLKKALMLI
ncbi:MAG: dephospho-CoA kinase, partial [Rhodospirillaceae bacterium]|nr:dephospho-CoA kinase [Rhodospirillaceae bacterium]